MQARLARNFRGRAVNRLDSLGTLRVLVDTGALYMCVPQNVATQLGFDVTEVRQRLVALADGCAKSLPVFASITIEFENRCYTTEALVLGDESMMGTRSILILRFRWLSREISTDTTPDSAAWSVWNLTLGA